ncbi:metallopeptidase TldD-related protein [Aquabacterium sp. OR-4]|uniref:metallopeptidase TldD-related protein n=1 Tax=Aquabacterium sp. OR-4 TaxID=2978127 RepID=UPI0021B26927|nr:metallopeptidase TldD-related protein [Aquabacterium sp. OR-4]MDT7835744.1 metallopeptidase TldD-related protein [Aquabacterium sp. OR-4]
MNPQQAAAGRAEIDAAAERALARLAAQGFDAAQVDISLRHSSEVSLMHDQPSLLRSGRAQRLVLAGIVDGRRAATELADWSPAALEQAVPLLWQAARAAPQDAAQAVSAGQQATLAAGSLADGDDPAPLAEALAGLLAWRAAHTPSVMLEESFVAHHAELQRSLGSAGSALAAAHGWHEVSVMGTARDGARSSSFNFGGGTCARLDDAPLATHFGLSQMLLGLVDSVHTRALGEKFVGSVVLSPPAVQSLLSWLLGQLADQALISGSSLYRARVGEAIASPLLSVQHRGGAPGTLAWSADGFAVAPCAVLEGGVLRRLTPSLYGSRKTGLPHVPLAATGWALQAGHTPLAELQAGVARGALVGRLSMGYPAANGDFSGVIKNSWVLRDGQVGAALSETMISGNMAQMLHAVSAVSRETLDTGAWCLPWLRVDGLHFS